MIEHPVDKAYREMNEVRTNILHAEGLGYFLSVDYLQTRLEGMVVSFTTLLLDTLRHKGYDARAAQRQIEVYVKIGSHPIDVWLYGLHRYNIEFRPTDTMYGALTALLPKYGYGGMYAFSILQVIDALEEIDTTIRTHGQCWTCQYSSVGAMGHGNQFYCGAGAVPIVPDCSQYEHYSSMQSLVSCIMA